MPWYDKKQKGWVADFRVGGKRYRKRGFLEKRFALLWEAQQRHKHELRLVDLPVSLTAEISKVIEAYVQHRERYNKASTVDRDKLALAWWIEFFSETCLRDTNEINESTWIKYRNWREKRITIRGKIPSNRTINIELSTINRCFKWAKKHGLVSKNPFENIEHYKRKKPGLPRYLTLEEIKKFSKLTKTKNPLLYECFIVLVSTGMRSGELCSLEINDVDLERKRIFLNPEKTKAGYQRIIPLQGEGYQVLKRLIKEAQQENRTRLFLTRQGTPRNVYNLNKLFKSHAQEAGITDVTIHDLRRTYISHMVMGGVPPVKVMSIVGHQDWATMKRYLALSPDYLQEDVEVLRY